MGLRCAFPRPDLNVMHSRERAGIDRDWSSCLFSSLLLSFSRQWRDFRPSLDHRFARSPHLLSWPIRTFKNLIPDYFKLLKFVWSTFSGIFVPISILVLFSRFHLVLAKPYTIHLALSSANQKHLSTLQLIADPFFCFSTPISIPVSEVQSWKLAAVPRWSNSNQTRKVVFYPFSCHLWFI